MLVDATDAQVNSDAVYRRLRVCYGLDCRSDHKPLALQFSVPSPSSTTPVPARPRDCKGWRPQSELDAHAFHPQTSAIKLGDDIETISKCIADAGMAVAYTTTSSRSSIRLARRSLHHDPALLEARENLARAITSEDKHVASSRVYAVKRALVGKFKLQRSRLDALQGKRESNYIRVVPSTLQLPPDPPVADKLEWPGMIETHFSNVFASSLPLDDLHSWFGSMVAAAAGHNSIEVPFQYLLQAKARLKFDKQLGGKYRVASEMIAHLPHDKLAAIHFAFQQRLNSKEGHTSRIADWSDLALYCIPKVANPQTVSKRSA